MENENTTPVQPLDASLKLSIREATAVKIYEIKQQAKNDIAEAKFSMEMELCADNKKAIDRASKKENRRRYIEVKNEQHRNSKKSYSIGEEIFNSVTHGIGAGLAIAALVLLIVKAVTQSPAGETVYYVVSWSIFGTTLVILYLMSTLYHALTPPRAKKVFAIFDHVSIYLLIAGTYTPFCLASLKGITGWTLFGVVWGLAIVGSTLYSIFGKKLRAASAITYLLMGWLIVFAFEPMRNVLPSISLSFLVAGGLAYTLGVIFYAMKKHKWMHSIWHLFVLAGSICHFFSVYYSI